MSVVPARGVLGALDPGDPLFAGEGVGLCSGEEGELGEVGLVKVFNFIGHCKYSKKVNLLTISLKLFE